MVEREQYSLHARVPVQQIIQIQYRTFFQDKLSFARLSQPDKQLMPFFSNVNFFIFLPFFMVKEKMRRHFIARSYVYRKLHVRFA